MPLYKPSTGDQTGRILWVTLYESTGFFLMTYAELLQQLEQMNEEQLNSDVCVYDEGVDEYYQLKVELVFATEECQVLDVDHPIIRF